MTHHATPACATRWSGIDAAQRLLAQFDDDFFVFNPASGHTHLLNALGVHVLELLDESPLSETELLARLQAEIGDGEVRLAGALSEHLRQLALMGLIEPES